MSTQPPPAPETPGLIDRLGRTSWSLLGIVLLVVICVFLFLRYSGLLVPSAVGIVLAVTLSPIVAVLARWHVPRIVGTLLVTLALIAVVAFLAWQFVIIVVSDSGHILGLLRTGATYLDHLVGHGALATSTIDRLTQMISSLARSVVSGLVPLAYKGLHAAYTLVVSIFLAGGFAFFFLWEGPLVREWVSRHIFLPEDTGRRVTASLVHTTRMYVLGVSCIGALQAVIVGTTAIVTGVSTWPVIAFAIFLGNYIPYVGGLVTGIFAVVLALGTAGPKAAVAVLIAILVSFIFVGPHIGVFFIGGALKMPVAAVFVLTMGGAALLGVFGAAAAAPLVRLVIDARRIIRESRTLDAAAPGLGPPAVDVPGPGSGPPAVSRAPHGRDGPEAVVQVPPSTSG